MQGPERIIDLQQQLEEFCLVKVKELYENCCTMQARFRKEPEPIPVNAQQRTDEKGLVQESEIAGNHATQHESEGAGGEGCQQDVDPMDFLSVAVASEGDASGALSEGMVGCLPADVGAGMLESNGNIAFESLPQASSFAPVGSAGGASLNAEDGGLQMTDEALLIQNSEPDAPSLDVL